MIGSFARRAVAARFLIPLTGALGIGLVLLLAYVSPTACNGQDHRVSFWNLVHADPTTDPLNARNFSPQAAISLVAGVRLLKQYVSCSEDRKGYDDPDPDAGTTTCFQKGAMLPMLNVNSNKNGPFDVVIWKSRQDQSREMDATFDRFCSTVLTSVGRTN